MMPSTLATGTGDGLHLLSVRTVVLRPESNLSRLPQARVPELFPANEPVTVRRASDLRPPPRWGLNE